MRSQHRDKENSAGTTVQSQDDDVNISPHRGDFLRPTKCWSQNTVHFSKG